MARCAQCGATILFGGVWENNQRFCNDNCREQSQLINVAMQVSDEDISENVWSVHGGPCPNCGGPGPVDVHTSYLVISIIVITSSRSRPQVSCRSCGIKAKLGGALLSGLFGWWGIPWGIMFTPFYITRNLVSIFLPPDPTHPSAKLEQLVRLNIGKQIQDGASQQDE